MGNDRLLNRCRDEKQKRQGEGDEMGTHGGRGGTVGAVAP